MLAHYVSRHEFNDDFGLTKAECEDIRRRFDGCATRWVDMGLTHFTYRSVYAGPEHRDVGRCDLMFGHPDWIDFYYDNDLGPLISGMCKNQQPYALEFFGMPKMFASPRYLRLVMEAVRHGMQYDFLTLFRDTPMSGGGLSGGRKREKLSKPALYAALGVGIEFHHDLNGRLGIAAARTMGLTETEVRYLNLLFYGLSQPEIAATSKVSRNWVAKTCMNMRRKLGVTSNSAAVAKALGLHIVQ